MLDAGGDGDGRRGSVGSGGATCGAGTGVSGGSSSPTPTGGPELWVGRPVASAGRRSRQPGRMRLGSVNTAAVGLGLSVVELGDFPPPQRVSEMSLGDGPQGVPGAGVIGPHHVDREHVRGHRCRGSGRRRRRDRRCRRGTERDGSGRWSVGRWWPRAATVRSLGCGVLRRARQGAGRCWRLVAAGRRRRRAGRRRAADCPRPTSVGATVCRASATVSRAARRVKTAQPIHARHSRMSLRSSPSSGPRSCAESCAQDGNPWLNGMPATATSSARDSDQEAEQQQQGAEAGSHSRHRLLWLADQLGLTVCGGGWGRRGGRCSWCRQGLRGAAAQELRGAGAGDGEGVQADEGQHDRRRRGGDGDGHGGGGDVHAGESDVADARQIAGRCGTWAAVGSRVTVSDARRLVGLMAWAAARAACSAWSVARRCASRRAPPSTTRPNTTNSASTTTTRNRLIEPCSRSSCAAGVFVTCATRGCRGHGPPR